MRTFTAAAWMSALALGMAWAVPAAAQDCNRALTVAMTSMRPTQGDAPLEQAADALLTELTTRSGVQLQRVDMPRMRAFVEFKAGRVDIVPMASRTEERDTWGQLLTLGRVKAMLIMPRHAPQAPQHLNDLNTLSTALVMVRGHQFGARFDAWVASMERAGKLTVVTDQGTAVRMIKAGRSAGAVGLPAVYESALRNEGWLEQVQTVDLNLGDPVDIGMYISRSLPAACTEALVRAAEHMRRHGTYPALLDRFLAPRMRQGLLP